MPTTAQLLDLADTVSSVAYTFRFDLLDLGLHVDPAGPLRPDRSRPAPTISNQLDSRAPRTVKGLQVDPAQLADLQLDVLSARVRPWLVLDNGDEFSLGIFLFDGAHRAVSTAGDSLTGGLVDQSFIIEQGLERAVGWGYGTPVTDAMAEVVGQYAYALPAGFDIVTSAVTLVEPVTFRPGSSGRQSLVKLCELAGYLPPYFDADGVGQLRPVPYLTGDDLLPDHVLDGRVYRDSIVESDDLLEAPNVWVVTSKSAGGAEVTGTYELPSSAPHSIARRGFRVPAFVESAGLGSSADCERVGQTVASTTEAAYEYVELDTSIDPRHDTAAICELGGLLWLETEWSFTMTPGAPMHHVLRRVYQ